MPSCSSFSMSSSMPRSASAGAHGLDLEHLQDVDRREPAADDERAVRHLVVRAVVAALGEVVEPVDEGVLVDEALADVGVGPGHRQRPVAPGAVREQHGAEAPLRHQRREVDVATDLGVRHEVDARPRELVVDGLVLLAPQLHVPARQAVLDLAVGPRVLLEDHRPRRRARRAWRPPRRRRSPRRRPPRRVSVST